MSPDRPGPLELTLSPNWTPITLDDEICKQRDRRLHEALIQQWMKDLCEKISPDITPWHTPPETPSALQVPPREVRDSPPWRRGKEPSTQSPRRRNPPKSGQKSPPRPTRSRDHGQPSGASGSPPVLEFGPGAGQRRPDERAKGKARMSSPPESPESPRSPRRSPRLRRLGSRTGRYVDDSENKIRAKLAQWRRELCDEERLIRSQGAVSPEQRLTESLLEWKQDVCPRGDEIPDAGVGMELARIKDEAVRSALSSPESPYTILERELKFIALRNPLGLF